MLFRTANDIGKIKIVKIKVAHKIVIKSSMANKKKEKK